MLLITIHVSVSLQELVSALIIFVFVRKSNVLSISVSTHIASTFVSLYLLISICASLSFFRISICLSIFRPTKLPVKSFIKASFGKFIFDFFEYFINLFLTFFEYFIADENA